VISPKKCPNCNSPPLQATDVTLSLAPLMRRQFGPPWACTMSSHWPCKPLKHWALPILAA
jgi:hypothetical protein